MRVIRIPRSSTRLVFYIVSIAITTFSIFATSNSSIPKRIAKAPSPTPQFTAVLGTEIGEVAHVTRVVDGDTFEIETGEKVRLIGVDTPETVDPRRAVGCYGKEAWAFTKALLLNNDVRLVKDVSETDVFGRLLRYAYLGDQFVNKTLVAEGYAHAKTYPPDISRQEELRAAERSALFEKKGLWGKACN